jgi:hypothetical protein
MSSMSSLDGRFAVIWGFPLFFIGDEGFCVVGFEIWKHGFCWIYYMGVLLILVLY